VTDPAELLRRHGAPAPMAVPMPTEIRSDGGLFFQLLQPPRWTWPGGTAVIAEWRCDLPLTQIVELRTFLARPDPESGVQPEAAINAALEALGVGAYLGTFVNEGPIMQAVCMMFAFRPRTLMTEEGLNRTLYRLLTDPPEGMGLASRALRHLRGVWQGGINRTEGRLMMLSQVDVLGQTGPDSSPFAAAELELARRAREGSPDGRMDAQEGGDDHAGSR
jgi:hypothetical protein